MTTTMTTDFSDLDDFDTNPQVRRESSSAVVCPKCNGTGRFVNFYGGGMGNCFTCAGFGKVDARKLKRQEAAKKGKATRATNLANKRATWRADNAQAAAWIDAAANRDSNIGRSLQDSLATYGSLTERQLAAVHRMMEGDAQRTAQRAEQRKIEAAQNAVSVAASSVDALKASLQKAIASGLKYPKLIIGEFEFKLASGAGKNPGAVYVTHRCDYAGKIIDGAFNPTRECDATARAQVATIMLDPLAAAVMHGKETGQCACCGRELTDPVSIERGIGPICAARYF